jgi:DNA-binding beta-propeller fold protein YncE
MNGTFGCADLRSGSRAGTAIGSLIAMFELAVAVLAVTVSVPAGPLYVMSAGKPTITIVNDKTFRPEAEIPLPAEPSFAVLDPQKPVAYVVYNGIFTTLGSPHKPYAKGKLVVVDLKQKRVVREIGLGWNAEGVFVSGNGKYLYCLSNGWRYLNRKGVADPEGVITIVDRETLETVKTLVPGRLATELAESADGTRLIVLAGGSVYLDHPLGQQERALLALLGKGREEKDARLLTYGVGGFEKQTEARLAGGPTEMLVGDDDRHVFLIDCGLSVLGGVAHAGWQFGRGHRGTVQIVDLETGSVERTEDAGIATLPVRWDPAKPSLEVVAQSGTDLRSSDLILLWAGLGQAAERCSLGKFSFPPASSLPVQQGDRAVVTFSLTLPGGIQALQPSHVAVVDMAGCQLARRVDIGSKGVRVAEKTAHIAALGAGLVFAELPTILVSLAVSSHLAHEGERRHLPEEVAADQDSQFVYALDAPSNRVTVVRLQDGTAVGNVVAGSGCRRVMLAPGGRFMLVQGGTHVVWISTKTHEKAGEYDFQDSRIVSLAPDEAANRVIVLGEDFLAAWDAEEGKMGPPVKGFKLPFQVLPPIQQPGPSGQRP